MRMKLLLGAGCWVTGCLWFTAPVQRLAVFVFLLASGQDSGRNGLFKAVTLVLRTDEQQGGFSIFAQFVQQSLDKNKVGNIVRMKFISCQICCAAGEAFICRFVNERNQKHTLETFGECKLTAFFILQIPDLEKELVHLKCPSAEDVSRVLESYQKQVRILLPVNHWTECQSW